MIETGDLLKRITSNDHWLATNHSLETADFARYENGIYDGYIGSQTYKQDTIREAIRDGHLDKQGNVRDYKTGAVRFHPKDEVMYSMDSETTLAIYEAVQNKSAPPTIDDSMAFWNASEQEVWRVDTMGWQDDNLASDLIRFDDGSVESLNTISKALEEGILVLMAEVKK